jgi:hypothetical protein
MIKKLIPILFFFTALQSFSQPVQRYRMALFAPLYLDSVFDATGNIRYDTKSPLPRFITPGLEFYFGARLALDSLEKRGAPLEVFVYDTRGRQTLPQLLNNPSFQQMELMIGQTNLAETKLLAEAAQQKKIPFISATLPNDAGVQKNPYMVVLNTSITAHVEGIYQFLQKNYRNERIIFFRRPGAQEDNLKNQFVEFAKSTVSPSLAIKFVDLPNDFSPQMVQAQLDSTRKNIVIAGSLDEGFGMRLTQSLSSLHSYASTLIGMPNWEGFNFNRYPDQEIVYTTPFFYNRTSFLENALAAEFTSRMTTKPSDMFFRGYETTLRFALLLLDTKKDLASSLTRKGNPVFTQFEIQPVMRDRTDMNLDYFENRHLYFVRVFGGAKNLVN